MAVMPFTRAWTLPIDRAPGAAGCPRPDHLAGAWAMLLQVAGQNILIRPQLVRPCRPAPWLSADAAGAAR